MSGLRIFGIILIVAGILGLAYDQFTYTSDTHDADIGPVELEVDEKETVRVPPWAGVAAIVVGGVMLLGSGRKST
jgi:hypothetical protein